jgi:hypothetical protein
MLIRQCEDGDHGAQVAPRGQLHRCKKLRGQLLMAHWFLIPPRPHQTRAVHRGGRKAALVQDAQAFFKQRLIGHDSSQNARKAAVARPPDGKRAAPGPEQTDGRMLYRTWLRPTRTETSSITPMRTPCWSPSSHCPG